MEDIEVNEYVRTSKGIIFQATKNIKINVNIPKKYKKIVDPITKHSFNLIDLLEVGDYVNGYRIDEIDDWNNLIHKARGINRSGFSIPVAQYNDDITSILTHELYEANCYKVIRNKESK